MSAGVVNVWFASPITEVHSTSTGGKPRKQLQRLVSAALCLVIAQLHQQLPSLRRFGKSKLKRLRARNNPLQSEKAGLRQLPVCGRGPLNEPLDRINLIQRGQLDGAACNPVQ